MYNTFQPNNRFNFQGFQPNTNVGNPYVPTAPIVQAPMVQPTLNVAQNVPQQGFVVQPVANIDEAKAVSTPMDGSVLIMTDLSNGKIYTKQLNFNTGSSVFNEYCIKTVSQPINNVSQETSMDVQPEKVNLKYVEHSEFNVLKNDFVNLKAEITENLNIINETLNKKNINESFDSQSKGKKGGINV